MKILATILIPLFLTIFIFSQEATKNKEISSSNNVQIAFVNGDTFEDENGIKRLYNLIQQSYQLNCFPLHWFEILDLEKELKDSNLPAAEREQKENYLKKLKKESQEALQKSHARYYKMVIQPIENEIFVSLKQIEEENKVIILQLEKLAEKDQILAINENFDITKQFISFFNNKDKNAKETLKLKLPETKIAVINTNSFFDKKIGLKSFTQFNEDLNQENFCVKTKLCPSIGESIQIFLKERNFSFIFDSSKELPEEIKNLSKEDVTRDFIAYYNKSN